jgi:hypothetical protein
VGADSQANLLIRPARGRRELHLLEREKCMMVRLFEFDRAKLALLLVAVTGALVLGFASQGAYAQETPEQETAAATEAAETTAVETAADPVAELASKMQVGMDTVWVLVTGMLVLFMNLGFACVVSGMCRAKNAVNIL